MKPELLSPVGSMESLYAAIEAGCDAVYLGGKLFGARAFAANFSNEELVTAIKYAHIYGVKVYVTVNTLIYDEEVDECLEYLKFLHKNNVDAVIMQDIGMIDLTRKVLPNLVIHGSTQMHIHNLSGTKLVESLGLKRVVLARETSIDDIKNIKNNTNIELEIFVEGALCISYSGQCLMSSLIGGRSGNRGMCAGSCRLPYNLVDEKGNKINDNSYIISTKDLNTLEHIKELIDTGVTSFKIEGRMKSKEYVYIVTSLYRKAIDSYLETGKVYIDKKELNDLMKIFNRGFTKGFIFNENNKDFINPYRPNHMGVKIGTVINYKNNYVTVKLSDELNINDGIRIVSDKDTGLVITSLYKNHERVNSASKGDIVSFRLEDIVKIDSDVLKTKDSKLMDDIDSIIDSKRRKVKINGVFKSYLNNKMELSISDGINNINISYGNIQKSIKVPTTKEDIIKHLSKLGDTPYIFDKLDILMDDNVFINIKDINEIRRLAVNELTDKRLDSTKYIEGTYNIKLDDYPKTNNTNILVSNIDIYNKLANRFDKVYIDDKDTFDKVSNAIYMTPRVLSKYDSMNSLVEVQELGGIGIYPKFETGAFLNVTNSYSVAFLHSMGSRMVTLSYELTYEQVKYLVECYIKRYNKHPNLEVVVYGRIEAMISKFNILNYYNVNGNYYLEDRFNRLYPIRIKDNNMIIYSSKEHIDTNNYFDIGVNNIRLDILNNSEINDIKLITKK